MKLSKWDKLLITYLSIMSVLAIVTIISGFQCYSAILPDKILEMNSTPNTIQATPWAYVFIGSALASMGFGSLGGLALVAYTSDEQGANKQ